jgi:oligosaccharide repeat unit polymerase
MNKSDLRDHKSGYDWQLLGLHIIYFVLLLLVYNAYVVVIYGYMGFHDAFNIQKAIVSPLIITAAFIFIKDKGLPSYFFLNLIVASTITPSLVIFSGSDLAFPFVAVTYLAFIILVFTAQFSKFPRLRSKHIKRHVMLYFLGGLSLLYIASIFAFGGGKFINFNLALVYEFRTEASSNLPGLFGYLMPTFSKAIVPVGVVLSLLHRQWTLLVIFLFCAVMIFALSSHKSPLFIPFAIIVIYWTLQYQNAIRLVVLVFIAIVIIGGLDFYLRQSGIGDYSGLIGSLGVRRSLLVPSYLNWIYYDFFSVNPYTYWADSKFSLGLIQSPYDLGIAQLIGRDALGTEGNANTGWIGSGMANAGYLGIIIYSVLIGLVLSLIDAYAKKHSSSLITALFLIPVMNAVRSTDFTNMFLTHGLFALLLIVIMLKPLSAKGNYAIE